MEGISIHQMGHSRERPCKLVQHTLLRLSVVGREGGIGVVMRMNLYLIYILIEHYPIHANHAHVNYITQQDQHLRHSAMSTRLYIT